MKEENTWKEAGWEPNKRVANEKDEWDSKNPIQSGLDSFKDLFVWQAMLIHVLLHLPHSLCRWLWT